MNSRFDPNEFISPLSEEEQIELRKHLNGQITEDDAVDMQCLMDGHSDKDRAASARDDSDLGRVVIQALRPHFQALPDLAKCRAILDEKIARHVPREILAKQVKLLLGEKYSELFEDR